MEWKSQLAKDLCTHTNSRNPVTGISKLAGKAVVESKNQSPPLEPLTIGEQFGLRGIDIESNLEADAELRAVVDGYRIVVSNDVATRRQGEALSKDLSQRQRFSCFHEIGHLMLDAFRQRIEYRKAATPISLIDHRVEHTEEEMLCDFAASEFMIPTSLFSPMMDELPLCWRSVEYLSRVFDASLTVVLKRILHSRNWKLNLVTFFPLDPEFPFHGFYVKDTRCSFGVPNYFRCGMIVEHGLLPSIANVYIDGVKRSEHVILSGVHAMLESVKRRVGLGTFSVQSLVAIND